MKIGSAQFPLFDASDPAQFPEILRSVENSYYLESLSPLWLALAGAGYRWVKAPVAEAFLSQWPGRKEREEKFRHHVAKAILFHLPDYFPTIIRRIDFLRSADARKPDDALRVTFRGLPHRISGEKGRLPLGVMIWRREKVCLLWINVRLTRRFTCVGDAEAHCVSWMDHLGLITDWLKVNGLSDYDTFLRDTGIEFGNNWWRELSSGENLTHQTFHFADSITSIWSVLRLVGTPSTQRDIAGLPHPMEESVDKKLLKKLTDHALEKYQDFATALDIERADASKKKKAKPKSGKSLGKRKAK